MGVYSVMLPDENMIEAVKGCKCVVIIGCTGCANDSLAYDKNLPLSLIWDQHIGQKVPAPDAILAEANRLKDIIIKSVDDVRIAVGMGLCLRSDDAKPDEWVASCSDADAVIALCCAGGMVGIKGYLGESVKVIPGMKTIGVHYCHRVINPKTGQMLIDRDKSSFIRIFERKPVK